MTGIAHQQGATNLNTYAYTFDGLSRPTSVVSTAEGTSSYSYDTISQVTGATHTGQSNETYGFDANGNRNTTGYTVGTNNQTTAGLGFTFSYDNQGNRLTRTETSTGKVQSYAWDFRNRLTAVIDRNTSGGAIVKRVDYEYDAYNRLVKRSLDADGAGPNPATTQYWAYDEGISAVMQFDGAAATNLSHRYLWSDRVDELFADEQITSPSVAGNTLWGLADNLGTLRDVADFNETTLATTVTNHRTFNANGKLVAETNAAVDLLFAFTGKQLDDSTGLQHNLFRWYDANLGQWLSEDPLGFAAGDENVRRYVGNRVTMATDPSGREDTWVGQMSTAIGAGILQGMANLANGLQDSAVGVVNLAIAIPNKTADLVFGANPGDLRLPYVTSPDWSRDTFVHESQLMHDISKGLSAGSAEILTGAAIAKLRWLREVPNNAAHNAADFARYQDELRAVMSKPYVTDVELARYMEELYRTGARIGSGSTAAAVRNELATGGKVGGRSHSQKAEGMITALERWLKKNPTASPGDTAAAENVIQDMRNALNGK